MGWGIAEKKTMELYHHTKYEPNLSNGLENISSKKNFNVNVDTDAGGSAIALPGLHPGS